MLLKPTEAPSVHIERLPDTATAAQVITYGNTFTVSVWASGPPMPATSSDDYDTFYVNYCDGCRFNESTVEINTDGEGITADFEGYEVELTGYANAYSPCSVYRDGCNDGTDFPCPAGYEGPSEEDSDDLSSTNLRYSMSFKYDKGLTHSHDDEIVFQWSEVKDGKFYTSSELAQCINTYEGGEVCWGSNTIPLTLLTMYETYTNAPANEDLCSFGTHEDNANDALHCSGEPIETDAFIVTKQQPAAVICAYIPENSSAFMLLATSGVTVDQCVAYTGVYLYTNVAIDADTVMNVWATDVLPVGKRLLFADVKDEEFNNAIYLGQVDPNFNLQPCKSIKSLSSEPVAQDNSLSPA
jgi:hypothetical protein